MGRLVTLMRRRIEALHQAQAESFAKGAIEAGVAAAPGPERSDASTGRARMSLATSNNNPAGYDPGELGSYPKPGDREALFGIQGRRPADAVAVSMGVPYESQVEKNYGVIAAAAEGGRARLKADQGANVRKATES